MVFIETERLIFRSHELCDVERFVQMQTDLRVRQYAGGSPWSEERARTRFRDEYLGQPVSYDGLWATVLKEEGVYIGHCGICAREKPTEVRLAYYLAQQYWGRGFATEASRAFVRYAFVTLETERIVADIQVGNIRSLRVLEKLGFTFHSSEEFRDRVFHHYELTREKWGEKDVTAL